MRSPAIKYTIYKQAIGNGWIMERSLLMYSEAWSIYRDDFVIGSKGGVNIDNEPHPGYMERYTKFWSNCSDAKEQAYAIAKQLTGVEL